MIIRDYDLYHLECDNCADEHPDEFDSFNDAVEAKKADGWGSRRQNGLWEDWCPQCLAASRDPREDFDNG